MLVKCCGICIGDVVQCISNGQSFGREKREDQKTTRGDLDL